MGGGELVSHCFDISMRSRLDERPVSEWKCVAFLIVVRNSSPRHAIRYLDSLRQVVRYYPNPLADMTQKQFGWINSAGKTSLSGLRRLSHSVVCTPNKLLLFLDSPF